MRRSVVWKWIMPVFIAVGASNAASAQTAVPAVDFNRDIRPILSETCFQCHGPDPKQRKADLRLDTRDGLFREHDGIKTLVPRQPAESELYLRITSDDETERMPPPKSARQLTPQQIALIKQWIEQGAEWKGHWSFIKPALPAVPNVPAGPFVRNDIDRFILTKLAEQGLKPSPEADRVTLIRRLNFDLIGLPPSPAEVDAFITDRSPNAYEKVVDRLLASPHYGERMAMYWLDLVRYADTNGYHGDNHEDRDLFRDYVINAFNDNKPFDQFTVEQIAGDLLPNATLDHKIASGYNRLLMTTREGGAQAKEYMAKYAADRVRNASTVWMGATLGCAECHDHKFDPFTTKDFYSFASFFADIEETAVGEQKGIPVPTPDQLAEIDRLDGKIAALTKQLDVPTPTLEAAQVAWEKQLRGDLAANRFGWNVAKPENLAAQQGTTLAAQDDLSVLTSGKNPDKEVYSVTLKTDRERITGIRLEALLHPSFANGSLSRANGNFVLTGVEVDVDESEDAAPQPVKLAAAVADFSQDTFPVTAAIDNKPATGWAVSGHEKKENRTAVFTFARPVPGGPGTTFTILLKHESTYAGHNIGRFRLSLTSAEKPSLDDKGVPDTVAVAVAIEPEKRTPQQKEVVLQHFRSVSPELAKLRAEIDKLKKDQDAVRKAMRTTLVSVSVTPRMMRVLPRGNWLDDSGEIVSPAVPGFLPQLPSNERATRTDLAHWLVSPDNPLVARVFVNRLWKMTFGQGLVRTSDDFGAQGTWPTHPALLDWLALEFANPKSEIPNPKSLPWDIKHLLRLIVTSATYRQSSLAAEALRQRDPYNLWLARQSRFRLDAEMVRDNALAVSGLLVKKIGGASVKPYQPAGYWSHLNFPVREYQPDHGENVYRRGLYTYWCRTFLHPSLKAFDAPTREECTVERPRSNTPLQALVLLNDPIYVEAARTFAERILRDGGSDFDHRLQFAYTQILSRAPRREEASLLAALYHRHLDQYRSDMQAATDLLAVGEHPSPKDANPAELAAWTSLARVIFNLHESITRN